MNMVNDDVVECIVSMPSQLFYSVTIPVSLWIMRKKKNQNTKGKVLFINAENLGHMIDRRIRELSDNDISEIVQTYHNWRNGTNYKDVIAFCKEATIDDIKEKDFILTPARYVGRKELANDTEWPHRSAKIADLLKEQVF